MRVVAIVTALLVGVVLLPAGPAQAAGCLKGAVVGGVAGHYVGHHGWLGATAGCVIGRHEANKRASQQNNQQQQDASYR